MSKWFEFIIFMVESVLFLRLVISPNLADGCSRSSLVSCISILSKKIFSVSSASVLLLDGERNGGVRIWWGLLPLGADLAKDIFSWLQLFCSCYDAIIIWFVGWNSVWHKFLGIHWACWTLYFAHSSGCCACVTRSLLTYSEAQFSLRLWLFPFWARLWDRVLRSLMLVYANVCSGCHARRVSIQFCWLQLFHFVFSVGVECLFETFLCFVIELWCFAEWFV